MKNKENNTDKYFRLLNNLQTLLTLQLNEVVSIIEIRKQYEKSLGLIVVKRSSEVDEFIYHKNDVISNSRNKKLNEFMVQNKNKFIWLLENRPKTNYTSIAQENIIKFEDMTKKIKRMKQEGYTYKQIACHFKCSMSDVKYHLNSK